MKPSFLHHANPLLTAMVLTDSPADAVATVRNALFDGCDAFGLQACYFDKKDRTRETLRSIFQYMEDKPIYVTNYRWRKNEGVDDDELAQGLIELLDAGATLADVVADLYAPDPMQITDEPRAVAKQKELVKRIHDAGGEALFSSHTNRFLPEEKVLEIAYKQQERGADVVKIVTCADSEEEEMENLRVTALLKHKLDVPYLFLSNGTHCKLHRMLGPMLGCVMCLCVQRHDLFSAKSQPVLRSVRAVLDNFDYKPNRAFEA